MRSVCTYKLKRIIKIFIARWVYESAVVVRASERFIFNYNSVKIPF